MSYARRYNLLALLDIPTEDDDGNTANEAPRTKYTGAEQKKYFNKKDLEECIKE
jgi:ERF superfamily